MIPLLKATKYFPYRTGIVRGTSVPRENTKSLEDKLYADLKLGGKSNHACFECIDENGKHCAVMFSDFSCTFGDIVEKRNW